MTYTTFAKLGAALAALTIAHAASAAAATNAAPSTGGLAYSDPTAPSIFSDGSTLAAPIGGIVGTTVTVSGTVAGAQPGQTIAVQRLDPVAGWVTAATTTAGPNGAFQASWRAQGPGRSAIRAVSAGAGAAARTAAATAIDSRPLTVYRRAVATWYGPGFYGHRTACGRRLTTRTLGVAHRKLPCGTLVDLYYNGQTVTVPVIDRGPFRRGTSYDLTAATACALGVTATTAIGAVPYRPAVSAPAS